MPDADHRYFFDTVTISNFALAGCLGLLSRRYGERLCLTEQVLDEIAGGIAAGHVALRSIEPLVEDQVFRHIALTAKERRIFRGLLRQLGPGEASCIAAAVCQQAIVATDDRAARACCAARDVACTGTVGILKACCLNQDLLPREADMLLAAMVSHGFYSPVHRVSDLL